jgi:regulator of protease activity HflC (stomatin/prohibitin superfamily)
MENKELNNPVNYAFAIFFMAILCVLFLGGLNFVYYKYCVWTERQVGLSELARAESNRKIKTLEAEAVKESAKFYSEAETIRAEGVAKANRIIGDSLKGNEAYLRYRWIEGLQTNQMQVVYIPTEAGLPLLEAGKRP